MKQIQVTIKNKFGLHARPASLLANLASSYQSSIFIIKDGATVNVKSIMNLLLLAATQGTVLDFSVDGPDEDQVVDALHTLIEVKQFDEE